MVDEWWAKEKQVSLLLKLAGKGDRRALKKAGRKLDELKTELEVERIVIAAVEAMRLKAYIERTRPTFRKSYYYDVWADSLILGKTRQAAIA